MCSERTQEILSLRSSHFSKDLVQGWLRVVSNWNNLQRIEDFFPLFSVSLFLEFEEVTIKIFQFSAVAQLCLTLCDPMDCTTPGFPVHHQLPELTQTYFHWVGDAIQPSHPLSSLSPPAFNLSQHQGLFQWVSSAHQVPKYWSFSFSSSPPNEYLGLISFRIDWLNLLAVQGTLKSLLQHHNTKASILRCSAFLMVQL